MGEKKMYRQKKMPGIKAMATYDTRICTHEDE